MGLFRGVVVANSMIRLALNPPAQWLRRRRSILPACILYEYKSDLVNPSVTAAVRTFSMNRVSLKNEVIDYDEVKKGIARKSFIIDVRNPHEIDATGKIPTSVNIPLDHVKKALLMNNVEFQRIYNTLKPNKKRELIFYCRAGNRAVEAAITAQKLGYAHAKVYSGSWVDWKAKIKDQKGD